MPTKKDKEHEKHPAAKSHAKPVPVHHPHHPHATPAKPKAHVLEQKLEPTPPVQGIFVSIGDTPSGVQMVLATGSDNSSHPIASIVKVTGADWLADLKAGDIITLIGEPATEIQVSH